MSVLLKNPYINDLDDWQRGNLHAHTTFSDGERDAQAVVDAYAERGYDFLMLSDHDWLGDVEALHNRGMVLLRGNEITAQGPHILHVDATREISPERDRQWVLNNIASHGGFAIMNHPNWERHFSHCPQPLLEKLQGYLGIEIYNGVVRRLDGSPLATDRWDRLLGLGRRVWGFANDDSHRACDDGLAWNMVQGHHRDAASVVRAMREGRFYASTGVRIESIHVAGSTITVRTANAQRMIVHSDFGHREMEVDNHRLSFTVPDDAPIRYVRVECWGPGETMAWTQPFFVEPCNQEEMSHDSA